MNEITLKAYAKINLCLDVTGKRDDGYHLLETVMHSVSIHDIVTIKKNDSDGISVSCSDGDIPCNEKNIAYKCAAAFFDKTGISGGVHIHIDKHIPSQAGMGGGSADGAAVLKGLNRLFDAGLAVELLCDMGAALGADIPFCIVGGCAYCTGIGEIMEPLPPMSGKLLIAKGNEGISTPQAFGRIDDEKVRLDLGNVKKTFSEQRSYSEIAPLCQNLFEKVTDCREVMNIKNTMLENGAVCSCMTGSGSAVFGLFEDDIKDYETEKILKKNGFFASVCDFINYGIYEVSTDE